MQKGDVIWLDGEFVPWDAAQVHVLTHTLHYGLGVFEGIRCYETTDRRSAVFRLRDHIRRLFASARILSVTIPYEESAIDAACLESIRRNKLRECYIRPLVFLGAGEMGLHATTNPVRVAIAVWPWGSYLGDEGVRDGIRVKTSSFQRFHVNTLMTKAKAVGHYVNSILANQEVRRAGYDEALMLDTDGFVAEASGENIFIVRDDIVKTPPLTAVLPGITRATLITLLRERGHVVIEERFTRDEVYIADEAFFTGTAAEVTPVRELDDRPIGSGRPGAVTSAMQAAYFSLIRGGDERHLDWLSFV